MFPKLDSTTCEEMLPDPVLRQASNVRILLLIVFPVKTPLAFILGNNHIFSFNLVSICCIPITCNVAFWHLHISSAFGVLLPLNAIN